MHEAGSRHLLQALRQIRLDEVQVLRWFIADQTSLEEKGPFRLVRQQIVRGDELELEVQSV